MSRWNGHRFLRKRTIYRGPQGFSGFTGLAFGPDGRLYSGVALNDQTDQKADTGPFARSVVSLKPNGTDIKVVATGLRQPWQMTFVNGNPNPFVSVLADERTPTPPDWIVNAKPGENYGYPTCTQAQKRPCRGFAKPVATLDDHASPMGISPIGQTLYVALFGGLGQGPVVVSMNTARQADQAVPQRLRRPGARGRHAEGQRLHGRPDRRDLPGQGRLGNTEGSG